MACKRGQTRGEEQHSGLNKEMHRRYREDWNTIEGVWPIQVVHSLLVIGHVRVGVDNALLQLHGQTGEAVQQALGPWHMLGLARAELTPWVGS